MKRRNVHSAPSGRHDIIRPAQLVSMALAAIAIFAASASAAPGDADSVTIIAGPGYDRSGIHRFFFGSDYRDVWTTPIRVEVLDLSREAGGLSPVRRVGGRQTKALALKGADGRSYTFRGLEKDVSGLLDEELQGTVVDDLVRDQMSAQHPASELVAGSLVRAAGIHTQTWRLVVLPDDPALGEFQQEFAGAIGFYGEFPTGPDEQRPGTFDLTEILGHKEFYAALDAGPMDQFDARAYLKARLVDFVLGDWDRHRRQWRWARYSEGGLLQPVPEDRDQAFSRYEGLVLGLVRTREPRFQNYGGTYAGIGGLTWNGRDQDRRLLVGLEAGDFRAAATELRSKLTDLVLEVSVATMPPDWRRVDGERLLKDLKGRRDALPEIADRFYRHLAGIVDVTMTNRAEVVDALRGSDGSLELTVRVPDSRVTGNEPGYHRTFQRGETDEVRLFGLGGDDRVTVTGPSGGIRLRFIGGDGNDTLAASGSGPAKLSDSSGENQAIGGSHDAKPYVPPPPPESAPWIQARDWGSVRWRTPWLSYGPDLGLFVGLGLDYRNYSFRKHPYAARHLIRGGYAFGEKSGRLEYRGEYRRENRGSYWSMLAFGSGLENIRYYGFGNESADRDDSDFTRIKITEYILHPGFNAPLGGKPILHVGPVLKYVETDEADSTLLNEEQPYGVGGFGEVGARAVLEFDTRDNALFPRRGILLAGRGTVYPELWDVEKTFGEVNGDLSVYASAGTRLTLAVRGGGKRVFGAYPFHEAAIIGGGRLGKGSLDEPDYTLRGFRAQRFAGRSSAWGNAELRLRLVKFTLVLPARWGVFGFTDAGRVWLDDEESDLWHTSAGGGLWFSFVDEAGTGSMGIAHSKEGDLFYFKGGFTY